MKESFKIRSMRRLSKFIFSYYKQIAILGICFAVFSIVLFFVVGIELKTNIKDMLPSNPKSIEFSKILDNFNAASSLYLVVEGNEEDTIPFARMIVSKVEEQEQFKSFIQYIKLEEDKDFINKNALLISKSNNVKNAFDLYNDVRLLPFIKAYNDNMEKVYLGEYKQENIATNKDELAVDGNMANVARFMELLIDYLNNPDNVSIESRASILANLMTTGEGIQISQDRRIVLVTIQPKVSWDDVEGVIDIINSLDAFIKGYSSADPRVNVLLGGMWAMQRDELKHMEQDMQYPPLIALALIVLLFIFSFRVSRGIIFVLLALVFALCWEIGLITLLFGQLTMMSSSFGIILVGLGIDFGIHLLTQYTESRGDGLDKQGALENAFLKTGYGVILGGITTAIAFYTLGLSESYAMLEFGLVTGSGILLCVISMITVLPASLIWFDKKDYKGKPSRYYFKYSFLEKAGNLSVRYPYYIVIICFIFTILMGYFALDNSFEYDMLKLEPQEAESIIASRLILDKFDMSTDYVMIALDDDKDKDVANLLYKEKFSALKKARRITKVLEANSNVAFVDSIASYVVPEERQRVNLDLLARFRELRKMQRGQTPLKEDGRFDVDSFIYEINRLEQNIIELGDLTITRFGDDSKIVKRRSHMIREIKANGEPGQSGKELFKKLISLINKDRERSAVYLGALSIFFTKEMDKRVDTLSSPTDIITLENLPKEIKNRYLSKDARYSLSTIFIKDNVWDAEILKELNAFFDAVKIRHLPRSYFYDDFVASDRKVLNQESALENNLILKRGEEKAVSPQKNTLEKVEINESSNFDLDLKALEDEQTKLLGAIEEEEKELKKDPNEYISFTGTPSIMLESINMFAKEGKRAMLIALVAICILVLLFTRNIKYTIFTLTPIILGFVWMVGLMYLSGIKFDFFNIMALPIILGIGIDDGIHLIHRFKIEGDDKAAIVLRYTGRGILLTSLTNVFAFGTISIFSSYVGLAGFGAVLSYGVIACFFVSVLFMPSLIYIFRKNGV